MIECLICHQVYKRLVNHLSSVHSIDTYRYLRQFPGATTTSISMRHQMSIRATKSRQWGPTILQKVAVPAAAYVTGFLEGDGHIATHTNESGTSLFRLGASQKKSEVLEYVRSVVTYGSVTHNRVSNTWQFNVTARGSCRDVMRILSEHVVSTKFLLRLNEALCAERMEIAISHYPTIDWLAGFFDAEGCAFSSTTHYNYVLTITQKERYVLETIQQVFGGRISTQGNYFAWRVTKGDEILQLANSLWIRSHNPEKRADLETLMTGLIVNKSVGRER